MLLRAFQKQFSLSVTYCQEGKRLHAIGRALFPFGLRSERLDAPSDYHIIKSSRSNHTMPRRRETAARDGGE
jgi:hypothetical protein